MEQMKIIVEDRWRHVRESCGTTIPWQRLTQQLVVPAKHERWNSFKHMFKLRNCYCVRLYVTSVTWLMTEGRLTSQYVLYTHHYSVFLFSVQWNTWQKTVKIWPETANITCVRQKCRIPRLLYQWLLRLFIWYYLLLVYIMYNYAFLFVEYAAIAQWQWRGLLCCWPVTFSNKKNPLSQSHGSDWVVITLVTLVK